MRSAHTRKRDANEKPIVDALRALGAVVERLNGDGVPDLLVGHRGRTFLIEVKNPESKGGAESGGRRTKGRGKLQPAQVTWFAAWPGAPVIEVVNVDEAIATVTA